MSLTPNKVPIKQRPDLIFASSALVYFKALVTCVYGYFESLSVETKRLQHVAEVGVSRNHHIVAAEIQCHANWLMVERRSQEENKTKLRRKQQLWKTLIFLSSCCQSETSNIPTRFVGCWCSHRLQFPLGDFFDCVSNQGLDSKDEAQRFWIYLSYLFIFRRVTVLLFLLTPQSFLPFIEYHSITGNLLLSPSISTRQLQSTKQENKDLHCRRASLWCQWRYCRFYFHATASSTPAFIHSYIHTHTHTFSLCCSQINTI